MSILNETQKDPSVAIVKVRVRTRLSAALESLHNTYPPNEITNILIDLFQRLQPSSQDFDFEDRKALQDASSNILKEFEHIRQIAKSRVDFDSMVDEDSVKIQSILNLQ